MKAGETVHRFTYVIVYSKDRKNIISRSNWLYQKDWKSYEAAAIKTIYYNGVVSFRDKAIDPNLWVNAALDDHLELAEKKRQEL